MIIDSLNEEARQEAGLPSKHQEELWMTQGNAISDQTRATDMEMAMLKLDLMLQDDSFRQFYNGLSKDEQSYLGILMIAGEDYGSIEMTDARADICQAGGEQI